MSGGTLPNGKCSKSDRVYIAAWRRLARVVARELTKETGKRWRLVGFDPSISFMSVGGGYVDLDPAVARVIYKLSTGSQL
jgi:hypothetical protein